MKDSKYNRLLEQAYIGTAYVPTSIDATEHMHSLVGDDIREESACFCAANETAIELASALEPGETLYFDHVKARDLKFHKAYMGMLGYIYDYLPPVFHRSCNKQDFYKFVKHLKGSYDIKFRFKDAQRKNELRQWLKDNKKQFRITYKTIDRIAENCSTSNMIEYRSISFGRMDERKFKEFIREQLPFIYSDIIGKFYEGEQYNDIIENIEKDWERFLDKLMH